MSDLMLLGVLRMPIDALDADALALTQFICRAREAADRIEADAKTIASLTAELEAAKHDIERHVQIASEYVRDAERYRWLRDPDNTDGPHMLASCGPEELDNTIDAALSASSDGAAKGGA